MQDKKQQLELLLVQFDRLVQNIGKGVCQGCILSHFFNLYAE